MLYISEQTEHFLRILRTLLTHYAVSRFRLCSSFSDKSYLQMLLISIFLAHCSNTINGSFHLINISIFIYQLCYASIMDITVNSVHSYPSS